MNVKVFNGDLNVVRVGAGIRSERLVHINGRHAFNSVFLCPFLM